jgi:hypothetical protein
MLQLLKPSPPPYLNFPSLLNFTWFEGRSVWRKSNSSLRSVRWAHSSHWHANRPGVALRTIF